MLGEGTGDRDGQGTRLQPVEDRRVCGPCVGTPVCAPVSVHRCSRVRTRVRTCRGELLKRARGGTCRVTKEAGKALGSPDYRRDIGRAVPASPRFVPLDSSSSVPHACSQYTGHAIRSRLRADGDSL